MKKYFLIIFIILGTFYISCSKEEIYYYKLKISYFDRKFMPVHSINCEKMNNFRDVKTLVVNNKEEIIPYLEALNTASYLDSVIMPDVRIRIECYGGELVHSILCMGRYKMLLDGVPIEPNEEIFSTVMSMLEKYTNKNLEYIF